MASDLSIADYRAALGAPRARIPVVASIFGRLPYAMLSMSFLLYVHRVTESFEVAGLVSASALIGVGIGAIIQGRLMDRFGPTRPLCWTAGIFCVFVAAELTVIETLRSAPLMILLAACVGLTQPTVGPASRALWGRLVADEKQRNAGYSYEAISMEAFFILGPGLAGLLTALPWGGAGVAVGAVSTVAGSIAFASASSVREWCPEPAAQSHRTLIGPLASPGMWTLIVAVLGFGLVLGSAEVAVPAMTGMYAAPTVGGLLLSLWAISSLVFGLAYSLRPWPRPMGIRAATLLAAFCGLTALLAVSTSLLVLVLLMLVAGTLITPQAATHSTAIEVAAPEDTTAEGFAWVMTSMTVGGALGQAISGTTVESFGPSVAFVVAGAIGLALAAVVWLRRTTLEPRVNAEERAAA